MKPATNSQSKEERSAHWVALLLVSFDALVDELYGLTEAEIRSVEGGL